ncbi:MAG: glycerol-3-phosphate dehydrogenase/oxidase [Bacillota bacterium]|nr:glycerol-3-phosphate dehydrogenase/oxidase [Bacillota bacterium]
MGDPDCTVCKAPGHETAGDRARRWGTLDQLWDVVVIGGGIAGAGIFREAARQGYRTVLLERGDFASGTSSRSGKLVHGGLRYLKQGQVRVTWHSVRERERLLRELPGLVTPLDILLPVYRGDPVGGFLLKVGLVIYDSMAMRRGHEYYPAPAFLGMAPLAREEGLLGGFRYRDALTDDARLVLRVIREGVTAGGVALNYAAVEELHCPRSGRVEGLTVRDAVTGRTAEVRARAAVNAAGIWADRLRVRLGRRPRLRLLRGSHLIFPEARLPVARGINVFHPADGRPLYVLPWEGVTLVGTTDVDHGEDPEGEPRISTVEAEYLLEAVRHQFPSLDLGPDDVLSTFAGVRAVVGTGKKDPSRESRDYAVWREEMLTVAGGKLTTFGVLARGALRRLRAPLPPAREPATRGSAAREAATREHAAPGGASPAPAARADAAPGTVGGAPALDPAAWLRLQGRYGREALDLVNKAGPGELEPVPGTATLWAELRWAAAREDVVHLDDLLLRRVRLGLQLPRGAIPLLDRIRPLVQGELGWDDTRWQQEVDRYVALWKSSYSPALAGASPR